MEIEELWKILSLEQLETINCLCIIYGKYFITISFDEINEMLEKTIDGISNELAELNNIKNKIDNEKL